MLKNVMSVGLPSVQESGCIAPNVNVNASLASQASCTRAIVSSLLPSDCGPRCDAVLLHRCSLRAQRHPLPERSVDHALVLPLVAAERHAEVTVELAAGLAQNTRLAPPVLLRPNSVPCGPRSTSTRSTSIRRMTGPVVRGMKTLSM